VKTRQWFGILGMLVCAAVGAQAGAITIIEQATGNGLLDGKSFSGELITITFTGDTNNIFVSGGDILLDGTATVSVAGTGSDTFTDTIQAYAIDSFGQAGFQDISGGSRVILESDSSLFDTYGLNTSIGPVVATPVTTGLSFPTVGGQFSITRLTTIGDSTSVSYTATAAAGAGGVPEPGSFLLLAAGIAGLAAIKSRVAT